MKDLVSVQQDTQASGSHSVRVEVLTFQITLMPICPCALYEGSRVVEVLLHSLLISALDVGLYELLALQCGILCLKPIPVAARS